MKKVSKFYEVLSYVKDLVVPIGAECNLCGIMVDVSVWNDYVTVEHSFKIYIAIGTWNVFTTLDEHELKQHDTLKTVLSISRVRGGYAIKEEKI